MASSKKPRPVALQGTSRKGRTMATVTTIGQIRGPCRKRSPCGDGCAAVAPAASCNFCRSGTAPGPSSAPCFRPEVAPEVFEAAARLLAGDVPGGRWRGPAGPRCTRGLRAVGPGPSGRVASGRGYPVSPGHGTAFLLVTAISGCARGGRTRSFASAQRRPALPPQYFETIAASRWSMLPIFTPRRAGHDHAVRRRLRWRARVPDAERAAVHRGRSDGARQGVLLREADVPCREVQTRRHLTSLDGRARVAFMDLQGRHGPRRGLPGRGRRTEVVRDGASSSSARA